MKFATQISPLLNLLKGSSKRLNAKECREGECSSACFAGRKGNGSKGVTQESYKVKSFQNCVS